MVTECFDINDCLSVVFEGKKHFTDGKSLYFECEPGVLEYIGSLSEAPVDLIDAFLSDDTLAD